MNKNQNNANVFSLETPCDQKITIFKNTISGNYFFAKPEPNAQNRVKASKVWIDDAGDICVRV